MAAQRCDRARIEDGDPHQLSAARLSVLKQKHLVTPSSPPLRVQLIRGCNRAMQPDNQPWSRWITPLWDEQARLSSGIPSVAAYTAPILDAERHVAEPGGERSVDISANVSELSESQHHIWC